MDPSCIRIAPRDRLGDRLSALPDFLLTDILSLLPTKTAVSTSILNTRYRLLWTQLTNINFDFPLQFTDYHFIVDRILTRLTSPVIYTFFLKAPVPCPPREYFERWLGLICSRNPHTIHITTDSNNLRPTFVHNCVFQTQALVRLTLPCFYQDDDDANFCITLPNLKDLALEFDETQCDFVSRLVKSCPLLEVLSLTYKDKWRRWGTNPIVIISSVSLIKLNLKGWHDCIKFVVDAPQLYYFKFKATYEIVTVSFVTKPLGLREAVIHTMFERQMLSLLPLVSHVSKLSIWAHTLEMVQDTHLSFSNLTDLTVCGPVPQGTPEGRDKSISLDVLLHVKRVHLKFGIFHYQIWSDNYPKKLIEYFLSNAPHLEMLKILVIHPRYPDKIDHDNEKRYETLFCIYLYNKYLRNSSHRCVVEFQGAYINLPANDEEKWRKLLNH